mgnify:CR=1 FL=1
MLNTARTLYDKLWDAHVVRQEPDGSSLLYIDRHLLHEVTSPQAFEGLQQASGGFLRLTDVLDTVPEDIVLAIDHKVTSIKEMGSAGDMEAEAHLFDLLEARFGAENARRRVIIKHFIKGGISERARARGYRTMCMMYPNEIAGADLTKWDVLGMEWNAPDDVWAQLRATGKPLIAHIITTTEQAARARERGATGLMSSVPSQVHP